ncbi:ArsC family reductase [Ramlibacter rhizophilus]|uniref:ArsC family reductase n=1 Tax=Ramlibacter rhizophilus TaxID=1781167 RepID=A0A4Z0BNF8_9BURK|nr:ArsC family reductase [Ramlibacter rhizophilus]TFY99959.1 ArsC family reductase [Ramlibacter rhizophilus]
MIIVHGIPNCDTVKKARAWLSARQVEHRFHDFRKDGLDAGRLAQWIAALGWEALLNRRGTTWRKLDEASRAAVMDARSASDLMLREPSLIRRPVVDWGPGLSVGFDEDDWAERLGRT